MNIILFNIDILTHLKKTVTKIICKNTRFVLLTI